MMTQFFKGQKTGSLLSFALMAVFSIGIGLMTYYTPKLQEDLEFMASNWQYVEGLTDVINWEGMWDDIKFHFIHTNGRLGDRLVIPMVCLVPEVVFAIMCGIMALLSVIGINRIACAGKHVTVKSAVLALTMVMIWFPWNESLFLASYSVNYLWTACISIWIAYLFLILLPNKRIKAPGMAFLCVCLCLSGGWHECIFMTLGCSLLLCSLLNNNKGTKCRQLTLVAAMFIGFLSNILSAGLQTRVGATELSFDIHHFFFIWHRLPIPTWPVIPVMLYFISLLIAYWHDIISPQNFIRKIHPLRQSASIHLACILTASSNLILFGFFGSPRSMLLGDVFAIIGLLYIFNHACQARVRKILVSSSALLLTLLLANQYITICFQARLKDAFAQQKLQWLELKGNDGVIYSDLPKMDASMSYPWEMIITDMYNAAWKHYYLANFIRPQDTPKNFIIIPSDLQHITSDSIKCVSEGWGIYKVKDHMLYSNPHNYDLTVNPANGKSCFAGIIIEAMANDGKPYKIYGKIMPFKTVDGSTMNYIDELYFNHNYNHPVDSILNVSVKLPSRQFHLPPTNYGR